MPISEILSSIVEHKRKEVAELEKIVKFSYLENLVRSDEQFISSSPGRLLARIKKDGKTPKIIAEIKRSSPLKVLVGQGFDPVGIARGYQQSNAAALSVLTESRFFSGSPSFIPLIKREVKIPILRKDFILSKWQMIETAALGADGILLMPVILKEKSLFEDLYYLSKELKLDPIVEVGNEDDLKMAIDIKAEIIGINNRDFRSPDLAVDINRSLDFICHIPSDVTVVSESGLSSAASIKLLMQHGIFTFLIGSYFMSYPDPGKKLKELLEAVS